MTSDDIFNGLLDLKKFCESKVPGVQVTISCPMVRTDNFFANAKLVEVKKRLVESDLSIIENDNITEEHLGVRGLHLKPPGTLLLSKNVGNFIRSL
jgi:hypothetical protein